MGQIIQDKEINEEAARDFLNDFYCGINLFPNIPAKVTPQIAAAVLNVSMPTIERMVQEKQLILTKSAIQNYIFANMLCNRPIVWDDEKQVEKPEQEPKKDLLESKINGKKQDDKSGNFLDLFSAEDLNQE